MIKEAIEKILELSTPALIPIGKRYYSTRKIEPVYDPVCASLEIHTLSGVVDWILNEGRDLEEKLFIQILDENTVQVKSAIKGQWKQRECFVNAHAFGRSPFPFGQSISIEQFIIELRSKFTNTSDRSRLLGDVSRVSGELVVVAEDDGAAQTVSIKDTIGRLTDKTLSPIYTLAPFRTFSEIKQPASEFLLRFKKQTGSLPTVAIFEADGGAWRNEAIANITEYFSEKQLPNTTIIS